MTSPTIVDLWLQSKNVSAADKQKIALMSQEELGIAFADKPLAFGTAGIRAKMGPGTQFLNRVTYYQMTSGYAKFLLEKFANQEVKVIVAHDNRNNGIQFAADVADLLTSMGIKVVLFDNNQLASTPVVSFAIRHIGAQGAVIVTASHNPKEDNGFKIYDETGGQVLPDDGKRIAQLMISPQEALALNVKSDDSLISFFDESIFEKYYLECLKAVIKTDIRENKNFPIIFSGQHGTASKRLPVFLKCLGYTNIICVKEQCEYDGNFSNTKTPNPENREAWDLSITYADRYNANVIVQVDPDADRFAIGLRHQGNWRFLSGNQMGIIYTYYVLRNKRFTKTPYVVSSWVSTNLIDRIVKDYGGKVYRVGTGFKWQGAKINEIGDREDFVVGFEEAVGALNSKINRDKDAYQAAALALEIYYECYKQGCDLVDLLETEIYGKYGQIYNETISFTFTEFNWTELAQQRMDKLLTYAAGKILNRPITAVKFNEGGGCIDWILDGDSWIRFRMSGTEPKFKVYLNLYGNSLAELNDEASAIDKEIRNLLDLK